MDTNEYKSNETGLTVQEDTSFIKRIINKIKGFFIKGENKSEKNPNQKNSILKLDEQKQIQKSFKEELKETSNQYIKIEELGENTYFEKRISNILVEFKKVFINLLKQKGINDYNENDSLGVIAIKTQNLYPNMEKDINKLLYFYLEEQDSEGKLDYLMRLYKKLKEK